MCVGLGVCVLTLSDEVSGENHPNARVALHRCAGDDNEQRLTGAASSWPCRARRRRQNARRLRTVAGWWTVAPRGERKKKYNNDDIRNNNINVEYYKRIRPGNRAEDAATYPNRGERERERDEEMKVRKTLTTAVVREHRDGTSLEVAGTAFVLWVYLCTIYLFFFFFLPNRCHLEVSTTYLHVYNNVIAHYSNLLK